MPKHVTHAEFLEAARPLLELCEIDPNTIFCDVEVAQAEDGLTITFLSAVDPGDGTEHVIVGADDPETSELGWPVVVQVDYR